MEHNFHTRFILVVLFISKSKKYVSGFLFSNRLYRFIIFILITIAFMYIINIILIIYCKLSKLVMVYRIYKKVYN